MTPQIDGYYTTEEAAEELGIARITVQKHIERGNIQPVKIGNAYLISAEELKKIRDLKRGPKPKTEG